MPRGERSGGAKHRSSTTYQPGDPANPLTATLGPVRASERQVAAVAAAARTAGAPEAEFIRTRLLGAIALEAELTDADGLLSRALHSDTREHLLFLIRTGGNVGKG